MERVAKRFLLHNKREVEEVNESDFNELKQDVQIVRGELLNNLRISKENLLRYTSVLHKGISVLGECFFRNENDSYITNKYNTFRGYELNIKKELNDLLQ